MAINCPKDSLNFLLRNRFIIIIIIIMSIDLGLKYCMRAPNNWNTFRDSANDWPVEDTTACTAADVKGSKRHRKQYGDRKCVTIATETTLSPEGWLTHPL